MYSFPSTISLFPVVPSSASMIKCFTVATSWLEDEVSVSSTTGSSADGKSVALQFYKALSKSYCMQLEFFERPNITTTTCNDWISPRLSTYTNRILLADDKFPEKHLLSRWILLCLPIHRRESKEDDFAGKSASRALQFQEIHLW